jgi:hypothetical protein
MEQKLTVYDPPEQNGVAEVLNCVGSSTILSGLVRP